MSEGYAGPFIAAEALGKQFGTRIALADVTFTVGPGEIVGLLGPNGAGKTTLIGCLLGFLLPSAGSIRLFGETAAELSPALRGRTGFVPQTMSGFGWFRVGELITYLGKFYAQEPGAPPPWLLDWAGLDPKARVKSLSGGQKQRLAIVLAMRHAPDLLILDEPVASLDPQARRDFMALLTRFCAQEGRSVLISSHILSDLEKIATRAIFMRHGSIIHDTPMARFRTSARWVAAPRDALPQHVSCLAEDRDTGALLVDGWDEASAAALAATLGAAPDVRIPDLETAFLEMTR
ncbi:MULTISPECIES: ABC transporter ATP-binding protein [Acidiphilium]|uniref:ABC-2 type transport system ATP-binding protein n=1 Tax=Acidiphilium rubrum TaxID=526 RepID=A0A8G2CJ38_ACIRU|nr:MULTISPECIES: ABC transporter ATP-binding protein [Acidiphilium]SIQ41343.1 ABC-2 type transport system ATP-binding protein [Acidiphilium rubrum]